MFWVFLSLLFRLWLFPFESLKGLANQFSSWFSAVALGGFCGVGWLFMNESFSLVWSLKSRFFYYHFSVLFVVGFSVGVLFSFLLSFLFLVLFWVSGVGFRRELFRPFFCFFGWAVFPMTLVFFVFGLCRFLFSLEQGWYLGGSFSDGVLVWNYWGLVFFVWAFMVFCLGVGAYCREVLRMYGGRKPWFLVLWGAFLVFMLTICMSPSGVEWGVLGQSPYHGVFQGVYLGEAQSMASPVEKPAAVLLSPWWEGLEEGTSLTPLEYGEVLQGVLVEVECGVLEGWGALEKVSPYIVSSPKCVGGERVWEEVWVLFFEGVVRGEVSFRFFEVGDREGLTWEVLGYRVAPPVREGVIRN